LDAMVLYVVKETALYGKCDHKSLRGTFPNTSAAIYH
jgi:hypothetical protein